MKSIKKTVYRANLKVDCTDFDPFALDVLAAPNNEACSNTFDPFSILPSNATAEISDQTPAVPASVARYGHNGNNMPVNLAEELIGVLGKRREGRMSTFTADRAADVIEGLENGETVNEIAVKIGVSRGTIWTWMQLSPEFKDLVARAREYQGHANADDAVKLLDEVVIDPDNPKAAMAELRKAEQRAKIRMELAKAFCFNQYGNKKQNLNLNLNADVSPVDLSRYSQTIV